MRMEEKRKERRVTNLKQGKRRKKLGYEGTKEEEVEKEVKRRKGKDWRGV